MITPRDIEEKVFSSGIKGYKKEEVDQFLDEIMLDMEALISENHKQKRLLADMKKELDSAGEKEKNLMKTLERARLLMNDISASAEKRAEIIVKNAKTEAADIISEAHDSIASLKEESKTLKANIAGLKIKYKDMLTDELNKLDGKAEDWFSDLREDFFPASMTMPEGNKTEAEVANLGDKTVVLDSNALEKIRMKETLTGDEPSSEARESADIEDLDPNILKSAENKPLEEKTLVDPAVEAGLFGEPELSEKPENISEAGAQEETIRTAKETENISEHEKTTLSDIVLPKDKDEDSFNSDGSTVVITREEMNRNLEVAPESEE
ncbi:DivIVA protein [Eubacterium nodatum ATCC 33099]|nr:DivIVA protein [Eubacterium nodatum ATCC 33099]